MLCAYFNTSNLNISLFINLFFFKDKIHKVDHKSPQIILTNITEIFFYIYALYILLCSILFL